jgi:microcystin-dependent protein
MAQPYIGEVRVFSFGFAPKGYAMCNGQLLPINQNQALFALLGTFYGGNGINNFALPDLRGRAPFHFGGAFVQGQVGGEEAHTLTVAEIPAHSHLLAATTNAPNVGSPSGNSWAQPATVDAYSPGPTDSAMGGTAIAGAGAGQPHNNLSPYLVVNFCIALVGVFPSRN